MNRFKPGDKARVIGNMEESKKYHGFKIGDHITIINKDGGDYLCKDKTGRKQIVADCDLEPIESPVQEEERLVAKLEEYIKLLTDELNDLVGMASIHGWKSTRFEAGEKLRSEIEELKRKP